MMFIFGFVCVVIGVITCLLVQYVFFKKWFQKLPTISTTYKSQYEPFKLPLDILDLLKTTDVVDEKESCVCLNLLLQFIFSELRDTKRIRRWVMNRMDIEFEELLQTTTTGKLLDSITVRDFNLGGVFPLIRNVSVHNAKLQDLNTLEEVSIDLDLDYSGGFQIAVDVDMVFGKSAYLSVKVTKLQGKARLQMTRIPFTHWTFTFIDEPLIEFDAESHFEGRPIAQLTSLIINQIKKSVRKKHTLPNYKIRYKPFFVKPEPPVILPDIYCRGSKISVGEMSVTVMKCSRLVTLPGEGDVLLYCSLALDKLPWTELLNSKRKLWTPHDCHVEKANALHVGLTFKEEFIIDRSEEMVVVEIVTPNSPADKSQIKKGDLIISVNGVKVNSQKQAVRLIKQASDSFHMRVERSSTMKRLQEEDFKYKEDSVSWMYPYEDKQSSEGYVNISIGSQKTSSHTSDESIKEESSFTTSLPSGLDNTDFKEQKRHRRKGSLDSDENASTSTKNEKNDENFNTSLRQNKSEPDMVKPEQPSSHRVTHLDLRKTTLIKASSDPCFGQEFTFHVRDKDRFLNVCIWGRVPEKLDKQNRVLKPEKSVLLGHVSIPVMDIALECLATLQGDYQQTFQLTPAELRAGASRAKFASLATHRGYDEKLCHGDITLAFMHTGQSISKADRKKIDKIRNSNQEMLIEQPVLSRKESKKLLLEDQHNFIYVKFTSATLCDFCRKKIWFKNGYNCNMCSYICHKKCMDRCQIATKCTNGSWSYRQSTTAEVVKKASKQIKADETMSSQNQANGSAASKLSLLSRFRRGDKGITPPPPSNISNKRGIMSLQLKKQKLLQLLERQKNTSTPSGSDSDQKSAKGADLLVPPAGISKTRSSPSIDELMKNRNTESDTDSENEGNLLQYYEKQKNVAKTDEMLVIEAKQMGKELFRNLPLDERKLKLDFMINKLQKDIDDTSEYRAEQSKQARLCSNLQQKEALQAQMIKTDEKIQSLAVLMLHYCAGLQHCMEEMELGKPDLTQSPMISNATSFESFKTDSNSTTPKSIQPQDDDMEITAPLELLRLASESEYLDAKEEFDNENDATYSKKVANDGKVTPEVEFEQQLTTAMQAIEDSEDEEERSTATNAASFLPNFKADYFSSDDVVKTADEQSPARMQMLQHEMIDSGDKVENDNLDLCDEEIKKENEMDNIVNTLIDNVSHQDLQIANVSAAHDSEENNTKLTEEGVSVEEVNKVVNALLGNSASSTALAETNPVVEVENDDMDNIVNALMDSMSEETKSQQADVLSIDVKDHDREKVTQHEEKKSENQSGPIKTKCTEVKADQTCSQKD